MVKPSLKNLRDSRRKSIRVASEDLVEAQPLRPDSPLPLMMSPRVSGVELLGWMKNNLEMVTEKLAQHGGILLRGFEINGAAEFEKFSDGISSGLLEYKERSSPRTNVHGNVYTSTDHPASQPIFLHNENSYQKQWPLKIFFYCETAAQSGGETPIADCRKIYQRVKPEVREKFAEKGWMYMRNFSDGFGLPWQTVFGTSDRAEVDAYCAKSGIQTEWKNDGYLRTRAIRRAIARHPLTGEMTWFNHATFFHVSTLPESVREVLMAGFAEEDLPTNTYYGDGSPIEPETLEHLRELYHSETVAFPWQEGDVLLLDNMMVCHGRAPFKGARKVLVSMAEPCTWDDINAAAKAAEGAELGVATPAGQ